jgi:hypothetical protein
MNISHKVATVLFGSLGLISSGSRGFAQDAKTPSVAPPPSAPSGSAGVPAAGASAGVPAAGASAVPAAVADSPAYPPAGIARDTAPGAGAPGAPSTAASLSTAVPSAEPSLERATMPRFLVGGGLSLGVFAPGDVNDALRWKTRGMVATQGFPDMFLHFVPRVVVGFAPIENLELQLMGEAGWAPKVLTVVNTGHTELVMFSRVSPGLLVNAVFPNETRKRAVFLGAGALYHAMSFESYRGSTPGFRLQGGMRLMSQRHFVVDVLGAFDYAVAGTGRPKPTSSAEMFLNYTSVQLGANMYWGGP